MISDSTNIVIAQESLVEWNDNRFRKDEKKSCMYSKVFVVCAEGLQLQSRKILLSIVFVVFVAFIPNLKI